jgi:uncharacterized paraquat-inducible protein A
LSNDRDGGSYHDLTIGTLYRIDPERLAALRRCMTGVTRCPECCTVNRADQPRCVKCGAKLYPEVEDSDEEKALKADLRRRKDHR